MKKSVKALLIIAAVLLALLIVFAAAAYSIFAEKFAAVNSIRRLDENERLYYMEYAGDYGFEEFLERGAASDEDVAAYMTEFISGGFYSYELSASDYACSTIAAVSPEGAQLCGRNFDWDDCSAIIVRATPKDGYASISTCNLNFIATDESFAPDADVMSSMVTLAAVYVPLDGMNEKGLCVADLIINGMDETHQDTGKTDLTTTTAIRLLLDRAANVDEAVELLGQYDMHSSAGMTHHLSISDASGKSVVVEYIDNVMCVTETHIVTNFILAEGESHGKGSESGSSLERYNRLTEIYSEKNGALDEGDIKAALEAVKDDTMWSIVYNKSELALELYFNENYAKAYSYSILGH